MGERKTSHALVALVKGLRRCLFDGECGTVRRARHASLGWCARANTKKHVLDVVDVAGDVDVHGIVPARARRRRSRAAFARVAARWPHDAHDAREKQRE